MTTRDKIIDQYWIEFIASWNVGEISVCEGSEYLNEGNFWLWFFKAKVSVSYSKSLEEYLNIDKSKKPTGGAV